MNYIHNDDDFATEPKRGLPALLPRGEFVLWQGAPHWRTFARETFRTHLIVGAVAAGSLLRFVLALGADKTVGIAAGEAFVIALFGAVGLAILYLLAWLVQKTTVYTITNKRLVLRIGVALQKTFNVPFAQIDAIAFKPSTKKQGETAGSLSVALKPGTSIAYLLLWPHARPWKMSHTQPTLRGILNAPKVGALLGDAFTAHVQEIAGTPITAVAVPESSMAEGVQDVDKSRRQDTQRKDTRLPEPAPFVRKTPVFMAFGLAGLTVIFVGLHQWTERQQASQSEGAQPIFSQTITVEPQDGGRLAIHATDGDELLATLEPGNSGLLRGAFRGLNTTRSQLSIDPAAPFRLDRIADDGLYLVDPETNRRIRLDSFGPVAEGPLANLLALGL
ncbi:MAG: PH domain-containing protein [Devosiaceae bacterium]|nr:PH domain-containing protein [Devosiaceae bacterium MH13]